MGLKIIITIVLALICILEGGLFALIPSSSTFITQLQFQSFTYSQYGALIIFLGLGAFLGGYLIPHLYKSKVIYKIFITGILSHIVSLFFFGLIFLSLFSAEINFIFSSLSLFFLGIADCLLVSLTITIATEIFPKKTPSAILILISLFGIGNALFTFLLDHEYIILLFALIGLSIISIFFLFDFFYPNIPDTQRMKFSSSKLVPLYIPLILMALNETLVMNWMILYLTDIEGISASYAHTILGVYFIFVVFGKSFWGALALLFPLRRIYWIIPAFLTLFALFLSFSYKNMAPLVIFSFLGLNSALWVVVLSFGVITFRQDPLKISGQMMGTFLISFGLGGYLLAKIHIFQWINVSGYFQLVSLTTFCVFICTLISLRQTKPISLKP